MSDEDRLEALLEATDCEAETFEHVASLLATAIDPGRMLPSAIQSVTQGTSTSKFYDDKGKRMRFAGELLKRAFSMRGKFWEPEQVLTLCEHYFEDVTEAKMPPTIGGLAMYLGWTQREFEDRLKVGGPVGAILSIAKEAIRLAIEMAALDGSINPLLYFHQQKAYHGVIEKSELIVSPIRLDPTPEEAAQIIDMLPDGTVDE